MVKHELKRLPKSTVELLITLSPDEVSKHYQTSFDTLHQELTIEGFRKGKAPKSIAEKHISKEKVYNHMVPNMLPGIYEAIVKQENLKPIVSPQVELVSAKDNEEWQFRIRVAEKPVIDLKDYKKKIKEVNSATKKTNIWVPGQEGAQSSAAKTPGDDESADKQKNLNEILSTLLRSTSVEVPDLIVQEEMNQRLSRLLDDIQKLGLTADAYLKSKNTTMDELKSRMAKEIEDTYKIEFLLAEIADQENITIDQKEMDSLFATIKDEAERKTAQENAYFYASVLRKQKTLEMLRSL